MGLVTKMSNDKDLVLGPTGEHPNGKIAEDDDGELQFAVGVTQSGEVFIDFGVKVKWFAMPPEEAMSLAQMIAANAQKAARVSDIIENQKTPEIVGADGNPIKE